MRKPNRCSDFPDLFLGAQGKTIIVQQKGAGISMLMETINVYENEDGGTGETLLLYRCIKIIPNNKFAVISVDYIDYSESTRKIQQSAFELMLYDFDASKRLYDSLDEAIHSFKQRFFEGNS